MKKSVLRQIIQEEISDFFKSDSPKPKYKKGDKIKISITANGLAKNVFIYADGMKEQFSNNYFDILPGETVSVTIPKTETSIESLKSLKVLHLSLTENQAK